MRKPADLTDAAELGSCIRIVAHLAERAWPGLTRAERRELSALLIAAVEVVHPSPAEPATRVH